MHFYQPRTKDKMFFYAGKEWKEDEGVVIFIMHVLYELKSSALQFCNILADTLSNKFGFKSSLIDPDLWLKPITRPGG